MRVRTIAVLAAALLIVSACGSDDESSAQTSAQTPAQSSPAESTPPAETEPPAETQPAAGQGFPVTIEHKFGTTTIDAKPERVVSMGYTDGDYVLALGVTPVAIRDWYGEQPGGLWPWATESAAASGGDIELLASTEINFEQIAALRPDVIIGIGSEMAEADYSKLSEIAPVVAPSDEYIQFGTPWDVMQLTIGKALGLEAEAQSLVDLVTSRIEAIVSDHPEWAGLSANISAISPDGSSFLYTPSDARGRLITDLGFEIPTAVSDLAGDLFYAQAPAEQIALNDGDLLVYTTFTPADREAVDALPLFQGLPVVAAGHSTYVDQIVNGAMSFSTTLSIPFALDEVVPAIEAALDGGSGESAGGIEPGADPDVDAVVAAYTAVFDSATTFDQKAPYLPDAESLRATIDGYATAGGAVGGIELQPTAVVITGDNAAVTYDVLFAGTAVYNDLTGAAVRQNGEWVITRDQFCGFMASARNPCP